MYINISVKYITVHVVADVSVSTFSLLLWRYFSSLFDKQDERHSCCAATSIMYRCFPHPDPAADPTCPLLAAVSVVLSAPVVLPTIDRFVLQFFEQTNLWD